MTQSPKAPLRSSSTSTGAPPAREQEYEKLLAACRVKITFVIEHVKEREPLQKSFSLGHTDWIRSVAFSPDGHLAVSGSVDKVIRKWEGRTGRSLRVMQGHSAGINSVVFSPHGRFILSGSDDNTLRLWHARDGVSLRTMEGHSARVLAVAFSPDGRLSISGSYDNTIRIWEVSSGREMRVLGGHSASVSSLAFSPNGRQILSGSDDKTARIWDVETGACTCVFEHPSTIWNVTFDPKGTSVLTGSYDSIVRIWDLDSERVRLLPGHSNGVWSVAFSPDGRLAISGATDNSLRILDLETGREVRIIQGHIDAVWSLAFSPDSRLAISGSDDRSLRIWDVETGFEMNEIKAYSSRLLSLAITSNANRALFGSKDSTLGLWDMESARAVRVLEGHSDDVLSVAFSPDGLRALSGSADNTVRLWFSNGLSFPLLQGHSPSISSVAFGLDGRQAFSSAFNGVICVWDLESPTETKVEAQTQYTNAKVLLVGDSGAGKTGLSMRLALDTWEPSDSTVGAWAKHLKLPISAAEGVEREIWLWDFGGQADQRLIHQLYMEDTALAVLVFDGQKEDLFESLGQWDRDLTRSSRKPFIKLLASGRADAGGLRVSRVEVEKFAPERGFRSPLFETSSKVGTGCHELKQAIIAGIQWEKIEWRSSPLLFKLLKEEIIRLKDEGRVLLRFNELRDALRLRLFGEEASFNDAELKAVVGLLAGPGVVWELKFGSWVLLQLERINAYAQAVIQTLRKDEHELGSIPEEKVLRGNLSYESSVARLEDAEEERIVLLAMHQALVERGLCLREHSEHGTFLIFPSYYAPGICRESVGSSKLPVQRIP